MMNLNQGPSYFKYNETFRDVTLYFIKVRNLEAN